jgi:hypothetical protein
VLCLRDPQGALRSVRQPLWQLSVGCWGYDSTRLVAATELRVVALEDLQDHARWFACVRGEPARVDRRARAL